MEMPLFSARRSVGKDMSREPTHLVNVRLLKRSGTWCTPNQAPNTLKRRCPLTLEPV